MKVFFVFVLFLFINSHFCSAGNPSGNKNVCATPNNPININIHGTGGEKGEKGEKGDSATPCKCNLQDSKKPSAHIQAMGKGPVTYHINKAIKDWSISSPLSHLAGGMKYHDGKLTVPTPGRYYIYTQLYYYLSKGRVFIRVNNNVVTMVQVPAHNGKDEGALYTAGVFNLKAGDIITVTAGNYPIRTAKIYMSATHTYFGAFLI